MKKKFKQKNGNNGAAQGRIRNEPMTEILGSEHGLWYFSDVDRIPLLV
jgi:hypothetical protein